MIYKDDVTKCDRCWTYHKAHPELEHGCATVAKRRGTSIADILGAYLRDFHRKGHK